MMQKRVQNAHEKSPSLADLRLREFVGQLGNFFRNSNQSTEILNALYQQYRPSSSIYESIIYLYTNSLNKPTMNKLLDKSIEYLHLNNDDTLLETPFDLQQIKCNEEIKDCNLLHHAITRHHENIFQLLLKFRFNPNSLLSDHKTPLSIAVVANNISPVKRLEYIQLLIAHGANPLIRDVNDVSPFQRLCGMESNYPIVYNFFRDYLCTVHPDQVQIEYNAGLKNALYNWCVPIVTDLLEHGAVLNALANADLFVNFLTQIASTIFKERRSMSYIDSFILCLIQIFLHNVPCDNSSICIEKFFELIYVPGVCFGANNDPFNHPSMINVKKFLSLAFHYGYLTRSGANEIRTKHLPEILTTPVQNSLVSQATRQQLVDTLNQCIDELNIKYHQNPVSLLLLSARKVRQSMIIVNQKYIEQLNISRQLKGLLLLPQ